MRRYASVSWAIMPVVLLVLLLLLLTRNPNQLSDGVVPGSETASMVKEMYIREDLYVFRDPLWVVELENGQKFTWSDAGWSCPPDYFLEASVGDTIVYGLVKSCGGRLSQKVLSIQKNTKG